MRYFAAILTVVLSLAVNTYSAHSAEGAFKGDVVAKWLPDGKRMELKRAFGFIDSKGQHWDVPKGTIVNGASIPRLLWTVVGSPFTGKYRKASVIHDHFCDVMGRPWQDVHRTFFYATLVEGNSLHHAKLLYAGVYTWGPRWEIVNGRPMRTRDPLRQPTDEELQNMSSWIKSADPSLSEIVSYSERVFPR
jgi:hypothetical protein